MRTEPKRVLLILLVFSTIVGTYDGIQDFRLRRMRLELISRIAKTKEEMTQRKKEKQNLENQVTSLQSEVSRLGALTPELLQLRSSMGLLRQQFRSATNGTPSMLHPDNIAAESWVAKVNLLKQQFENWPGKKSPEASLLTQDDWLAETVYSDPDSETASRKAMGMLRSRAQAHLAEEIDLALRAFTSRNPGTMPSELSELIPFLKPSVVSILNDYEIAKPGWVKTPLQYFPNSQIQGGFGSSTWAVVMKGSFNSDGLRSDGSILADPVHDTYPVIYPGLVILSLSPSSPNSR